MTEGRGWTSVLLYGTSRPWSVSVEWSGSLDLALFAVVTGIPLVDLSIEFEPWLVRGDQ